MHINMAVHKFFFYIFIYLLFYLLFIVSPFIHTHTHKYFYNIFRMLPAFRLVAHSNEYKYTCFRPPLPLWPAFQYFPGSLMPFVLISNESTYLFCNTFQLTPQRLRAQKLIWQQRNCWSSSHVRMYVYMCFFFIYIFSKFLCASILFATLKRALWSQFILLAYFELHF